MDDNKHTPGPWQMHDEAYAPEEIFGAMEFVDGCAKGTQICTCEPCDGMLSNARLISAAPELLAAASKAAKMIDALLGFYGKGLAVIYWHQNGAEEPLDNFFDENSEGNELELLRAAIAKAEGRA